MTKNAPTWKCRPTPAQELLLKACLLRGNETVRAWEAWISQADIDLLDGGSIRLLPLLSVSLKREGIETPQMQRFKGVYRQNWYKNQILIRGMTPALMAFEEAGIPTLLLKGAALIHEYYPDYGLRPMSDFDLLVPASEAWRAMEMLRARGWQMTNGEELYRPERVLEDREQGFRSPDNQRLDLHWHALDIFFDKSGAEKTDAMFWGGAQPTLFHGARTAVPRPADLLVHVCVHGSEGFVRVPPLRWIADCFFLLNKPGVEMDWDRLLKHAHDHHLSLPLCDTLGYLSETFDAPVPSTVLQRLRAIPASRRDQVLYALWTMPSGKRPAFIPPATPMEAFQSHYRSYRNWKTASNETNKGSRNLFHYLQQAWGLKSSGDIPRTLWRRTARKFSAAVTAARNRRALLKTSGKAS